MLQSYQAQLQGNQVVWLGAAPPPLAKPRRVVVVMDEAINDNQSLSLTEILARARGSLGHASREAVLAELTQSRQAWDR
ncbi:MAG: hypothetical protein Q8O85_15630 [Rhodoferax sp.]|uniref:hypothetical protein n=1 Tax=Rhodoferax sp. TaxID=50421 RepID=UPI0008B780C5|nr:hypothetical protein [Rhodoferax sp.]MDP2680133.1 hypothetical protein [Rhodoferax sp.]OGB51408.1 MAG: hypothetical protein A2503_06885 [Burkholderiales bacterium RIFOXYD12_FULL_59_19]